MIKPVAMGQLALVLLTAACTTSTSAALDGSAANDGGAVSANQYDQTCVADTDCVLVADGDACGACAGRCDNAAIAAHEAARFLADWRKAQQSCAMDMGFCPIGCLAFSARCQGGKCAAVKCTAGSSGDGGC